MANPYPDAFLVSSSSNNCWLKASIGLQVSYDRCYFRRKNRDSGIQSLHQADQYGLTECSVNLLRLPAESGWARFFIYKVT